MNRLVLLFLLKILGIDLGVVWRRTVKRMLLKIILCGMVAIPAVVMPMNQANAARDCTVCFEERPVADFIQLACGHGGRCLECLQRSVTEAINRGLIGDIRCSNVACLAPLTQNEVCRLIPEGNLRVAYDRLRIQADPNGRFCPRPNCNRAYIYNPAQGPQEIACQDCDGRYCNNCLVQHFRGARCQPRNGAMNAVRGNPNVRVCPRCEVVIFREAGCNYIRCNCGHEFCWMCLVPDPGHGHRNCLPADLARVREIYGDYAGEANNNGIGFARLQPGAPAAFVWNQPAGRPGAHVPGAHVGGVPPNVPPRNRFPFIIACGAVAGAGVAAYQLYQYLSVPNELSVKDLEVSFGDLLKEANRCKNLADKGFYVRYSFKNYFAQKEKNKAFASLDATKLAALKKMVDDLESALIVGHCEREFIALVNFKIASEASKDIVAASKPDVAQVPVATKQPQVKKAASKKHTNLRGRSVKRVK